MLIKLSDTQWINPALIRRLFIQQLDDEQPRNPVYKIAADIDGCGVCYGLGFTNFQEAVDMLALTACAISEATRHEK